MKLMKIIVCILISWVKKYDQEIPQLHTVDQQLAPWGRDTVTRHQEDKVKQPALSSSARWLQNYRGHLVLHCFEKWYIFKGYIHSVLIWLNMVFHWYLTFIATIATKVVCFSRLLSLYGKQCGPRSDCSYRSSLLWVHAVCFFTLFVSNVRQLFAADDFSRWHFQIRFFLGTLSFNIKCICTS